MQAENTFQLSTRTHSQFQSSQNQIKSQIIFLTHTTKLPLHVVNQNSNFLSNCTALPSEQKHKKTSPELQQETFAILLSVHEAFLVH